MLWLMPVLALIGLKTHNLGVAPELILIKRRGPSAADWVWYVGPLGAGNFMYGDAGAKLQYDYME